MRVFHVKSDTIVISWTYKFYNVVQAYISFSSYNVQIIPLIQMGLIWNNFTEVLSTMPFTTNRSNGHALPDKMDTRAKSMIF